jgi:hypothetical protein
MALYATASKTLNSDYDNKRIGNFGKNFHSSLFVVESMELSTGGPRKEAGQAGLSFLDTGPVFSSTDYTLSPHTMSVSNLRPLSIIRALDWAQPTDRMFRNVD